MRTPALAVVGADRRIIRSTDTFRRKCEGAAALCKRSPELNLVLTGQTDAAVVHLGEFSVAIEAVTDAAGKRQAILSLPEEDVAADPDSPLAALREAADESPAIVWVKDLEGRYLYINLRYERDLQTSEERLRGNSDADLPPVETVDGPRLRFAEDGLEEPLALEYSVPAFEARPPMVAFRFPLCDGDGQPIGTCGVAAPNNEAQLARDEAVRLMQLERWSRLDPLDVRAEVLEQWHVEATLGPVEAASSDGHANTAHERAALPTSDEVSSYQREEEWVRQLRQAARMGPSETASETADALQSELQLARRWAERADQLQDDLQQAYARIRAAEAEAQQAVAAAQLAAEESSRHEAEFECERDEAQAARAEAQAARSQAQAARSEAEAARSEAEAARRELGAARTQAESLRVPADAAVRVSEELGRALAAERERGDELARTLARLRTRLAELESARERKAPPKATGSTRR